MRLRLYDLRTSEFPATNGLCPPDIAGVANLANRCQRRLLYCREAGEEGWWGTFAEVVFNAVSRTVPYITCPREIARLEVIDVCKRPVPIRNQFYEYLEFGNGRMPKRCRMDNWGVIEAFERNSVVLFADLPSASQQLAIYTTNTVDITNGLRVLVQGLDQNGSQVYTMDGDNQVMGEFVTFAAPFAATIFSYSKITGIQKDATNGSVQLFAIDPNTAAQTEILEMEPGEQVAGYRRYYLNNLPYDCCSGNTTPPVPVQVRAIAKLEPIPVKVDSDYLLIQNLEAFIEEGWAVHFSDLEEASAQQQAAIHHLNATRLLNGELTHYLGKNKPSVSFKPFGSASLNRLHITMR